MALQHQVQGLLAAGDGQQLLGLDVYAVVAEELRRALAQGGVALGLAVLQKAHAVFRQNLLRKAGHDVALQGGVCGIAARKGDDLRVGPGA